jgi:PAS domain S-box-containing protein
MAWLTLGIASVALALIAALVLRSERESTAVLHHLNVLALDLQEVLSDLADAESAERGYLLTGQSSSLENYKRSRVALHLEFDRLTVLLHNNPLARQEVERVRYLVKQDLDELQRSIAGRTAARSQAIFAKTLTDRGRKLTEALRQSIGGINEQEQGMLAQLARRRRVRLASALAAVSGALLLGAGYVLIGQIIIARSASRHRRTEEALRASEKRFETLCEQAPVGIYSTNAQGLFVYTNPRWSQISGLSAAESLGHGWKKALHPEDRDTVFQGWTINALEGASWEYRLLTPEGEIRWIRALGGPIYSNHGALTGYVGTLEDVTERKRAAERFRLVFEAAPSGMVMVDRNGKIVLANSRAEELFGYGRGELLGNAIEILVPEASRQRHVGYRSEFYSLPMARPMGIGRDLYARRKDGSQFPVEIGLNPIETEEGTCVLSSILDITARKRTESAMRETLQELQLITNNMEAGVSRCSRDLHYKWVSSRYAAWLGRPQEEIVGQPISNVLGRETYAAVAPHYDRVLAGGKEEYEIKVKYPSVGSRWIHAVQVPTRGSDQEVDGWITVVTDVTDRHEAEERLRESEARFRAAFFQAAVGIAQTSVDGKWQLFNDRFCQILGYSRNELREKALIEKTLLNIAHPDDREAFLAARHKLLAGEISWWSSEKRYIRKDGATVWARVSMSLVRDQDNKPQYFVAVVEDITEKIQAERALQQSRQELRALAGRLINAEDEERKRISRELHDDLSQKLALLAFNIGGLLVEHAPSAEKINEQLRNLQVHVKQLAQDVRQISHQLHPSILDDLGLVAALTELCEEFSSREGIEVAFESEAVPRVLPVDLASCLYRVSQEALHNVLKHAQASQARLRLSASADGIHLCIHDNGVGFDSEASLSRPGLGIVSMKERISLVQGDFAIDSRPGQGTEVKVFIPLSRKAA